MNVAEEQILGILVFRRNTRLEFLENIQLGEISFRFVEVLEVMTAPAKCLPFGMLNSARVNASLLEGVFMFCREVFANNRNHAHVCEIAGSKSKVGPGAAEDIVGAAGRSRDVVESDRANGKYAHLPAVSTVIMCLGLGFSCDSIVQRLLSQPILGAQKSSSPCIPRNLYSPGAMSSKSYRRSRSVVTLRTADLPASSSTPNPSRTAP